MHLVLGRPDPSFDAVRFASSWLVSPVVLLAIRSLFSIYAFATRIYVLVYEGTRSTADFDHDWSYFTDLTFWGLAFYFLFAAIHTGSYAFSKSHVPLLARWPGILQYLHSLLYTTITVYPFLVTIVFWSILFKPPFVNREAAWQNISQHALNSVFAVFEIIVPRTNPQPWLHILWLVIILALYLAVAFITHATEHFWVYDFLNNQDHTRAIVAAYIIGILVGAIVIYLIVKGVVALRKWVTEKKLGKMGKGYGLAGPLDGAEYVETKETGSVV